MPIVMCAQQQKDSRRDPPPVLCHPAALSGAVMVIDQMKKLTLSLKNESATTKARLLLIGARHNLTDN
jgi:hypothetical protein